MIKNIEKKSFKYAIIAVHVKNTLKSRIMNAMRPRFSDIIFLICTCTCTHAHTHTHTHTQTHTHTSTYIYIYIYIYIYNFFCVPKEKKVNILKWIDSQRDFHLKNYSFSSYVRFQHGHGFLQRIINVFQVWSHVYTAVIVSMGCFCLLISG